MVKEIAKYSLLFVLPIQLHAQPENYGTGAAARAAAAAQAAARKTDKERAIDVAVSAEKSKKIKIEKITDYLIEILPIHALFETVKTGNSLWPGKENSFTPEQLSCIRNVMGLAMYRKYVHTKVVEYANLPTTSLDRDLNFLSNGFGKNIGALMFMFASKQPWNTDLEKSIQPKHVEWWERFLIDPDLSDLRATLNLGRIYGSSANQNVNILFTRLLAEGYAECNIPLSKLL
jgi:hypothetical protein